MRSSPRHKYHNVHRLGGDDVLVQKPAGILSYVPGTNGTGVRSRAACSQVRCLSAGDGSNGRFGAVQPSDLTEVSLKSLWQEDVEHYGCGRNGRKTREEVDYIIWVSVKGQEGGL